MATEPIANQIVNAILSARPHPTPMRCIDWHVNKQARAIPLPQVLNPGNQRELLPLSTFCRVGSR